MTLRTLTRAATTTMSSTAVPLPSSNCQLSCMVRSLLPRVAAAKIATAAGADAEADEAHQQRLEQNHSPKHPIRGSHGLEDPEVAQVVQGEVVEDLAGDRGADDKPDDDHEAEVGENAGVLHEILQ